MTEETYTLAHELQTEIKEREAAEKQLKKFLFENKSWHKDKPTSMEVDGKNGVVGLPIWILREALQDWVSENPDRVSAVIDKFYKLPG